MGFWSGLAKVGGIIGAGVAAPFTGGASLTSLPGLLAMGGSLAGTAASSMAHNRGAKLDASQEQDRINTLRGVEDRNSQGDAWKRLLQAQYILNKKSGYSPANTGAGQLPSYGTASNMGATPDQMTGANGMQAEAMRRLTQGSQLPPLTDVNQLSKQGVFEKILGIAAPIATGLGHMAGQQPVSRPATPQFVPPRSNNPWDNVNFG